MWAHLKGLLEAVPGGTIKKFAKCIDIYLLIYIIILVQFSNTEFFVHLYLMAVTLNFLFIFTE